MTAPVRFRKDDIRRAVEAIRAAVDDTVTHVTVDRDGKVTVYFVETEPVSDLDKWRKGRARAA